MSCSQALSRLFARPDLYPANGNEEQQRLARGLRGATFGLFRELQRLGVRASFSDEGPNDLICVLASVLCDCSCMGL